VLSRRAGVALALGLLALPWGAQAQDLECTMESGCDQGGPCPLRNLPYEEFIAAPPTDRGGRNIPAVAERPFDPESGDRMLVRGFVVDGVIPNPVDDSVWFAQPGGAPGGPIEDRGRILRYDPATDRHEAFVPPIPGSGPRGVDVDTKGTIWVALGGSGHLGKFERGKCAQTFGAGEQCPEGWTLYPSPGPRMRVTPGDPNQKGADFHYYLFVDQFDTLGLGKDVVVLNGTGSDSLLAFEPAKAQWTVIRVPYPLNTYTRGLDGRIDDPAAGWKGRGLWFTNGLDPLIHSELPRSYVGKVQLRPDPLAR